MKRQPIPGKNSSTPPNNLNESTSVSSTTKSKDESKTVFNSSIDNNLIVKDAYGDLGTTINSMYKFTTTIDLSTINSVLKGTLGSLRKVSSFLKQANAIKKALKSGNYMDALGKIAPGAKAALAKAGVDPAVFDKFHAAAVISIKAHGTYKKIKNGELDLLTGLNDLARAITGHDLAIIKDIQAIKAAVGGIIKEFSDVGIEIKEEWDKLTKSEKDGYNISTELAIELLPDLALNGDYGTMLAAIKCSDPQRINKIGSNIVRDILTKFSYNSVFNKGRDDEEIYRDIMSVIRALSGEDFLWIERENIRNMFNMELFLSASPDFKKLAKTVLSKKFFKEEGSENSYPYSHEMNEVLILLSSVFRRTNSFQSELNRDFNGFIVNKLETVNTSVTPTMFKNIASNEINKLYNRK